MAVTQQGRLRGSTHSQAGAPRHSLTWGSPTAAAALLILTSKHPLLLAKLRLQVCASPGWAGQPSRKQAVGPALLPSPWLASVERRPGTQHANGGRSVANK